MVMSTDERDVIVGVVTKMEEIASMTPEHSTTRTTLYRLSKELRVLVNQSVTTSTFRGSPVKS